MARRPGVDRPGWTPGRLVGTTGNARYRFVRLLGAGGIGEVYEALDLTTQQPVAIKTLKPALRDVLEAARRLEREARAGGLLDHPNIVDVTELAMLEDGTLFVVMELVPGTDVGTLLEDGPLPPRRALEVARQTLDGLGHAHARGVLHRDLKPENLMVSPAPGGGDLVKILDFGLVKLIGFAAAEVGTEKLTASGAILGTPAYMAPEQALGEATTVQTDLYALGTVLFEMLTREPPFVAADNLATMRLQVKARAPAVSDLVGAPWCTPALDALIARALEKEPANRFADAAEMRAAVVEVQRGLPEG